MEVQHYEYYNSPAGRIGLAASGLGLVRVWFCGKSKEREGCVTSLNTQAPLAHDVDMLPQGSHPVLDITRQWLDVYFTGRDPGFVPPLDFGDATAFRLRVWRLLLDIPFGETTTYGALAHEVARQTGRERMSAQAVGQAVGSNPIPIIVPCHRVLGSQGQLTGYAYGLDCKRALLRLEGQVLPEG